VTDCVYSSVFGNSNHASDVVKVSTHMHRNARGLKENKHYSVVSSSYFYFSAFSRHQSDLLLAWSQPLEHRIQMCTELSQRRGKVIFIPITFWAEDLSEYLPSIN
jgi:hypothetical protein